VTRVPVVIVADDLTGAQDAAVQFRPFGEAVTLLSPEHWGEFASWPVVAVTAESRALSAAEAAQRLRSVARRLTEVYGKARPRVYKKIDSMLRGCLGQEIEALLEGLGLTCAVVAPAYPAQGRITAGGFHLVRGIPLALSDAGRDPLTPVAESHLGRLLAQQSRHPVGQLPLDVVMAGAPAIRRHLQGLIAGGVRVVAADATTEAHLEALGAAVATDPTILPCGSAGLAGPLARAWLPTAAGEGRREMAGSEPPGDYASRPAACPARRRGTLVICGTQSRGGVAQVAEVRAGGAAEVLALAPNRLIVLDERRRVVEECAQAAAHALRQSKDVLIHIAEAGEPGDASEETPVGPAVQAKSARKVSAVILSVLGELGQRLAGEAERLVLTGGDTAMAVCAVLGVRAIAVGAELLPGVVAGRMLGVGGVGAGVCGMPGMPVITKAGSFGDSSTLVRILSLPR
jgi:uncharacterized protein YgbK (DUF1537 family)